MAYYATYVPQSAGEDERKQKQKLDDMLRAIEGAQASVANNLGIWIRSVERPKGQQQARQAWDRMDSARAEENRLFMELFASYGVHGERQKAIGR